MEGKSVIKRYGLRDDQWERIKGLLPGRKKEKRENKKVNFFDKLPNEILLEIFRYCDPLTLNYQLLVCRHSKEIAQKRLEQWEYWNSFLIPNQQRKNIPAAQHPRYIYLTQLEAIDTTKISLKAFLLHPQLKAIDKHTERLLDYFKAYKYPRSDKPVELTHNAHACLRALMSNDQLVVNIARNLAIMNTHEKSAFDTLRTYQADYYPSYKSYRGHIRTEYYRHAPAPGPLHGPMRINQDHQIPESWKCWKLSS